eukprot:g70083.t1
MIASEILKYKIGMEEELDEDWKIPSEHSDDPEYIPSAEATESEQEQEQGGGQGSDGDDEPLLNVDAEL